MRWRVPETNNDCFGNYDLNRYCLDVCKLWGVLITLLISK